MPTITPPDILSSIRLENRYRDVNVYFIVSFHDDKPLEIFATFPTQGEPKLELTMAGTDGMCRLISLCLRSGVTIDNVCKQLQKSSRNRGDMPDLLTSALKTATKLYILEDENVQEA